MLTWTLVKQLGEPCGFCSTTFQDGPGASQPPLVLKGSFSQWCVSKGLTNGFPEENKALIVMFANFSG